MGEDDNQALTTQCTKKGKTKKEEHSHKKPRRSKKDYSQFRCYTCDEKGHLVRDCPKRKGKKKRYNAHVTEDDELVKKRAREDSSSDEEYVLISSLTGMVTHGSNFWLVYVFLPST